MSSSVSHPLSLGNSAISVSAEIVLASSLEDWFGVAMCGWMDGKEIRSIMQVAYSLQSTASYGSMKYAQIAELLNGKQNISLEPGGQFELSGEVNSYLYQILILLVHHKILGLMQKLNVKSQTDPEISQNTLNS
nr:glutamate--cysteine ligase, chloroplastic isoform X2 [Ipomoea batatas]